MRKIAKTFKSLMLSMVLIFGLIIFGVNGFAPSFAADEKNFGENQAKVYAAYVVGEENASLDLESETSVTLLKVSKPGYDFVGWRLSGLDTIAVGELSYLFSNQADSTLIDYDLASEYEIDWVNGAENLTISYTNETQTSSSGLVLAEAIFDLSTNTQYKIKHYFETLDGNFVVDETKTNILAGTTDSFVSANSYILTEIEGFEQKDNASQLLSSNVLADGSLVLKVYYSRTLHTVTWKNGNAVLEIDENVKYGQVPSYNGAVPYQESTVAHSYEFAGWAPAVSAVDADATYLATFNEVARKYAITYTLDDDVDNKSNATYHSYGTDTAISDPTRIGYEFAGWLVNDSQEPVKNLTLLADAYSGDISLTATWTAENYIITYNTDGGINSSSNPTQYTILSDEITLFKATKRGYDFIEWQDASGNKIETIAAGSTGDIELFAIWQAQEYDIIYQNIDGIDEGQTIPSIHTYGQITEVGNITKEGYNFVGWLVNSDTTPVLDLQLSATAFNNNITLTAVFDTIQYQIIYGNMDGATNHESNPDYYTIESTIYLNAASKAGYKFLYWTDVNGDRITEIAAGNTEDIEIF